MASITRSGIYIGNAEGRQLALVDYSKSFEQPIRSKIIQARIIGMEDAALDLIYAATDPSLGHRELLSALIHCFSYANSTEYGLASIVTKNCVLKLIGAGNMQLTHDELVGYGRSDEFNLGLSLEPLQKVAALYGLEARVEQQYGLS